MSNLELLFQPFEESVKDTKSVDGFYKFFKDEATAIAAGYRPCGCCMREKYKRWKPAMEAGEVWNG